MYPQSMFRAKKKKNITIFSLKITIFTDMKNSSILHRHVCVMHQNWIMLFRVGAIRGHLRVFVLSHNKVSF